MDSHKNAHKIAGLILRFTLPLVIVAGVAGIAVGITNEWAALMRVFRSESAGAFLCFIVAGVGLLAAASKWSGLSFLDLDKKQAENAPQSQAHAAAADAMGGPAPGAAGKPSFHAEMERIASVLERKAQLADQKASVLLDRGVMIAWLGIIFFVASIVAWQVLAWNKDGMHAQFIFGAVSCTVLFVFMQFLSAWFLKQYRHFIEVSTYLLEIKSVFDRYTLLYTLANDPEAKNPAEGAAMASLIRSLSDEMKWPRARPAFTEDAYYAKDAAAAVPDVVRSIRGENPAGTPKF